jgi:diacylglycerol O-acyltransferase 1
MLQRIKQAVESVYGSAHSAVTGGGHGKGGDEKTPSMSHAEIRQHPSIHPVHVKQTTSMLSTAEVGELGQIQKIDFRGILNLFFILLFVLNVRLVIENIIRYGPLLHIPHIGLFDSPLIFLGYVLVFGLPYFTYVTERFIAMNNRKLAHGLHVLVIAVSLFMPYWIVASSPIHPLRSLGLLMASVVYAMKIGSYWHVCSDLYDLHTQGKLQQIPAGSTEVESQIIEQAKMYPACLSASQMYMFIAYPTLVFQLVYPRTPSVRLRIVVRYIAELVFCLFLQFFIIEQYITPILNNTITGVEARIDRHEGIPGMVWFLLERFLKLSIPNLYIWLLSFAVFFHCYLNILAEVTRFADRKFYLDWWNAVSIRDYWQKWNQPVHSWLLRHLYKPLRQFGFKADNAGMIVFIFSGVVHEYLIITPIGVRWNGLVTMGFVLQLPLISFTDSQFIKDRPTFGNCLFWLTSCFTGQPMATLTHFVAASSPTIFWKLLDWLVSGHANIHVEL